VIMNGSTKDSFFRICPPSTASFHLLNTPISRNQALPNSSITKLYQPLLSSGQQCTGPSTMMPLITMPLKSPCSIHDHIPSNHTSLTLPSRHFTQAPDPMSLLPHQFQPSTHHILQPTLAHIFSS
jgi:hypothetical protein